ncbi:uncharacterized protein BDZ99DRAFT_571608 [Mytilinidion resinicola]|uniref:Uncharacterized protein n=1 Tax=Mytilinidion resinicola TaxID=574789 RepID=A0A6A6YIM6_9PEZI|nr:uncharacterized protein BDZ99DRAFT_571608 [Mytilinidion resinicola]KAF2808712.1 hypothetical protein BDZ99DRAFT_571608 [Mytilinidion resinicola]
MVIRTTKTFFNSLFATLSTSREFKIVFQATQFKSNKATMFRNQHLADQLCSEEQATSFNTARIDENHVLYSQCSNGNQDVIMPVELDNSIHPVFDQENFECEDHVYEAIKPALRLATLFITEEKMLCWWTSLVQSKLTLEQPAFILPDHPSSPEIYQQQIRVTLSRDARIDATSTLTGVRNRFNSLAKGTTFRFLTGSEKNSNAFSAHGRQWWKSHGNPIIGLSDTFRSYAEDLHIRTKEREIEILEYLDSVQRAGHEHFSEVMPRTKYSAQDLCVLFRLAQALVHEIAHAFYALPWGNSHPEPLFHYDEPESEMGLSWENSVFGALPTASESLAAHCHCCESSVTIEDWGARVDAKDAADSEPADPKRHLILPMSWVRDWFLKATWSTIAADGADFMQRPQPVSVIVEYEKFWRRANVIDAVTVAQHMPRR